MQPSLIALLGACLVFAAQGYYFGFYRPVRYLVWLQKSLFVFMTFFLIPMLGYVLWLQMGAANRLEAVGIVPHPSIRHAVGMVVGRGETPLWMFAIDPDGTDELEFYEDSIHRKGWAVVSENQISLSLEKGKDRMNISISHQLASSIVVYRMSHAEADSTRDSS